MGVVSGSISVIRGSTSPILFVRIFWKPLTGLQDLQNSQDKLISIIERFGEQRIVILGDAIADKFLHGAISRVSREAPVFILRHQNTETRPGGAANCAMNLVALGAHVSLISVTGDDESGSELRAKLEAAEVNIDGV